MESTVKNYYDLLEVSPRARIDVIKAVYKVLMNIYHPNKTKSNRVAKSLNEAYQVFSNRNLFQDNNACIMAS